MQLQQAGVELDGAKAKVLRDMHIQRQARNMAPTLVSSERKAVTVGRESDQKTFDDGGWDKMYQGMQAASFLNAIHSFLPFGTITSDDSPAQAFLLLLTQWLRLLSTRTLQDVTWAYLVSRPKHKLSR
jgi:hypothetical protein